jgi:nanoRNase/pAp phosphatase (c-di-AMP/oligoRNAs hydrolase)
MKIESIPIKKETEQNFKKLMDMARPDDSLLLLLHGSPDPDAIASAMALREIIQRTKAWLKVFLFPRNRWSDNKMPNLFWPCASIFT